MGRFSKLLASSFALFLVAALMAPVAAFGDQLEAGALSDSKSGSVQIAKLQTQANDTFDKALSISVNAGYSGAVSDYNDEDWYKFTLPSAGRLDLKMGSSSTAASGDWEVRLYDSSKEELAYNTFSLGGTASQTMSTIGLPSGTFYVRVKQGWNGVANVVYTLTPSFT